MDSRTFHDTGGADLPGPRALAVVLDEVCEGVLEAAREHKDLSYLLVSEEIYATLLEARPREFERGNPMLLFDLEVRPDRLLSGTETVLSH